MRFNGNGKLIDIDKKSSVDVEYNLQLKQEVASASRHGGMRARERGHEDLSGQIKICRRRVETE